VRRLVGVFSKTMLGVRDAALLLIGFASGLRRAEYYFWLAESGPDPGRANYLRRRDMIIIECQRRGTMGIIDRAIAVHSRRLVRP